VASNKS